MAAMNASGHDWVLVLAAGEGKRLRQLTKCADGASVPKQYCSLQGGPSLLEEALRRAASVADSVHVSLIVADQHRRWWQPTRPWPAHQLIVQPHNRGTANGILLQLLQIMRVDPDANVMLLPSDHFIADESTLITAMRSAFTALRAAPGQIVLLGMEPSFPDPELGYIAPGRNSAQGTFAVADFVEKPSVQKARELIASGALWSTFILAAHAAALLELFERHYPHVVSAMRQALAAEQEAATRLASLYETLPDLDFSRDVLARANRQRLRVLPVARCGWSDLGTPEHVAQALAQPAPARETGRSAAAREAPVNLASMLRVTTPMRQPAVGESGKMPVHHGVY
jgi:mannose-1-phosphate guanylyltransferase